MFGKVGYVLQILIRLTYQAILLKELKIEQKNKKKFVCCSNFYTMILDLEHIGNIPVSTSVIASLFTNIEAGN